MGTNDPGTNGDANQDESRSWFVKNWRTLCISTIFITLFVLMRYETWPFQEKNVAIGRWLDIVKFLFDDMIFVGIFRLALIGLGFYAVLSMASQILRDRWITGLSKDGFHIDELEEINTKSEEIIKDRDDALSRAEALEGVAKEHQEKTGQLESENQKLGEDLIQLGKGLDQAEQDRDRALSIIDELQDTLISQKKKLDDYARLAAVAGNKDD